MSVSRNSYKKIQNVRDAFEVRWEQNTIVNIGQKHIALFRKAPDGSSTNNLAVVELPPYPARYCNFCDLEKAGQFESEASKKKFYVHLKTGTPTTLDLAATQKQNLLAEQKSAVDVLQEIDELCYKAMWEAPGVLKKKKKTIKRALEKNGATGDELERMAFEMFKDQGQSGVVLADDDTHDIKTKMAAYRRVRGSDGATEGFEPRKPQLVHRDVDGTTKQVDFKGFGGETTVNRGALIAAHVRIKPYVTPNGAYGTTLTYVGGQMLCNGPAMGSSLEYSSYDYLGAAASASTSPPPLKRAKTES